MPPVIMDSLQRLGRALMLPIAILPIAGLLLRLGDTDLLNIALIHQAGTAIMANLGLIFAIGIAVGFARDNNGTAGLAGAIGYLVLLAVLKTIDPSIDMGVLAGIISGLTAGALYNRFKDIKLPEYLAFFGGRRFVPIATGLCTLCLGLLLGLIWPPLQHGINSLGQLLLDSGSIGAFAFGALNRLLIITGLHHILNNLVWFVFGSFTDPETGRLVTGDLARYFAGDPKGGQFMAGMFPMMMFGLPAACLAMYRNARPERRKLTGGLLLSAALTSFLTGVTEPVEFAFMFLAPLLYLVHALLTGLSMALTDWLNIRLGFTFSGGAIDLALGWGKSHNGWMLLPLGLLYGGLYYLIFDQFIRRFNLSTPGREVQEPRPDEEPASAATPADRTAAYISALGGAANLIVIDACTTRLRLQLADRELANEQQLKALGAMAVVKPGTSGSLQVVVGPQADSLADKIRQALPNDLPAPVPAVPQSEVVVAAAPLPQVRQSELEPALLDKWLSALGGSDNVQLIEHVAITRMRLRLTDIKRINTAQLSALGALGISYLDHGICHVLLGAQAKPLSDALLAHIAN
ncbi:N-acetylglucosamine-specific PTS transporter subunit IIBC [Pseudomonas sp. 5P_3.1_Bac2]|uniref:N-acetylglucosamine-specific PTS transporter subunit IIBC n=1 Tax=Pseudomonas sp. 5P_3.1_Bac2 TaxID=2971617 RepID=UPI0021C8248E|nr:N-acetylglucosamine-specific PTS transporter subunit IIBC [Pseudomonas sp. 5P_3.1_Bac2]MCU1719597.1 N-acetylglucosamine-specific PTS transporter subunit IIBC [Pseudomonas sp. 5P_3.1_Bac2]